MTFKRIKINISLFIFKVFFNLFKLFSVQEKTTFVTAFGANISAVLQTVEAETEDAIVVLKTKQSERHFNGENRLVLDFSRDKVWQHLKGIYHLATSRFVFVDTDFLFLSVTSFKDETKCIQLWHTAGSIKQFGLKRRSLPHYVDVYKRFDHIVVGSNKMARLYNESFGQLKKGSLLKTGVPRTDFFYNDVLRKQTEIRLAETFPAIKDKEVILYAPTYREYDLNEDKFAETLGKLYNELKYDFVLFLGLHPKDNLSYENKFPSFIYNVTSYPNVNDLTLVSDLLITDYSSIPFEFALLNKPMIFYAFDLKEFEASRGFTEDYRSAAPGPVIENTSDLIKTIKNRTYDLDRVKKFAEDWNEYGQGQASLNLVNHLYKKNNSELK